MGWDVITIKKERQEQKWAFEKKLTATEALTARKEVLATVGYTFVVVVDDDNGVNFGPHIVNGKRSSQATADFEPGFQHADERPREAVADPKRQATMNTPHV